MKAKKYLLKRYPELNEIDITTSPPSAKELKWLINRSGRPYTDFLNRSGVKYRELNLKEKVKTWAKEFVINLMVSEGRLLKRPIVTDGGKKVTVGFNDKEFKKVWG